MSVVHYKAHFDTDRLSALFELPISISIEEYLYQNPPNTDEDTSYDFLDVVTEWPSSTLDISTPVNVRVSKKQQRPALRKEEILQSRKRHDFLLGRLAELDEQRKLDLEERRADRDRIRHLEGDIRLLQERQEVNEQVLEAQVDRQHTVLKFETLARLFRSLNDKVLRDARHWYANPTLKLLPHLNYLDKMIVAAAAAGALSNATFKQEVKNLVDQRDAYLVPGLRPFGVLPADTGDLKESDPSDLYAKKLLQFLTTRELRLALQIFVILNDPKSPIREDRNIIAHLRPSIKHAKNFVSICSVEDPGFEKVVALDIIDKNEPFQDLHGSLPFGEVEADEGLQHMLAYSVEKFRKLYVE